MQYLILCCFFISGACGLVYEVAWLRVMGLIFGNTTFATSTVLAGYMAGLGLGALWWGKRIDRCGDPVRIYAGLEAGIGAYALLTPLIWMLLDVLNIGFYRFISPSFFTALAFKFTISFCALLVPTFLMGATLPVLSKYFVHREEEVARQVGMLYGLNTFGAVLGVIFSGFIAIQTFGVWQTVYLTGILNLFIFCLCYRYGAVIKPVPAKKEKEAGDAQVLGMEAFSPKLTYFLLALFAVSGAVSMMYEIAWTRVLAMVLGSSVYAFCIMLGTFLVGISLGSYLFSRMPRVFAADLQSFSAFQMITAITAFLGINMFNDMPYYFVKVFAAAKGSDLLLNIGKFLLCSIVMLPPTLCIGAMFSCFIHILRRSQPLGKEIGEAYFANTIGTIAGSVLTGFFIIPFAGIQNTLAIGAWISASIGVITFFLGRRPGDWKRRLAFGAMLAAAVFSARNVAPWNQGLISSDLAVNPEKSVGVRKEKLLGEMEAREILFYREGLSATVTVTRIRDNRFLSVNGKADASMGNEDKFTQALLGHLPMALHGSPGKVLIIGLGSGATAAAVASYPIEKLDVVELEKTVVEGAGYFHDFNREVLKDPRMRIHVNDGRNFALIHPEKYDVIISEPSNPWIAGVANLFSIEHYRTMNKRLAPGGIVCQWFHSYSMSQDDLRMIVRTFSEVFQDVSLWTSYPSDLMLIGKNEPLNLDMRNFERAYSIPAVREDLRPHGILDAAGFMSNAILFDKALRMLAKDALINSDNHPYLEFSAPRNLYRKTLDDNLMLFSKFRKLDSMPEISNLEPPARRNAGFCNSIARGYLAKRFLNEAEGMLARSAEIDPENPETLLLYGILYYQTGWKDEACELFIHASQKDPKSATAFYNLGRILQEKGRMPEAIEALGKAHALDGRNSSYIVALANAYLKSEQWEQALSCFAKALEIQPDDFESWRKNTLLIIRKQSDGEGQKAAMYMIRKYPSFSGAYGWLGDLHEKNGRPQEAFNVYIEMKERFPHHAAAYVGLARTSALLGKPGEGKKYATMAVRMDPSLGQDPVVQAAMQSR